VGFVLIYQIAEPLHDSTRRLTTKVNQLTDHIRNGNQSSESPVPQTDISDQHKHTETMKHTVYQFCRSTAAPSKSFCFVKCFTLLT